MGCLKTSFARVFSALDARSSYHACAQHNKTTSQRCAFATGACFNFSRSVAQPVCQLSFSLPSLEFELGVAFDAWQNLSTSVCWSHRTRRRPWPSVHHSALVNPHPEAEPAQHHWRTLTTEYCRYGAGGWWSDRRRTGGSWPRTAGNRYTTVSHGPTRANSSWVLAVQGYYNQWFDSTGWHCVNTDASTYKTPWMNSSRTCNALRSVTRTILKD